ncbi:Divergent AAA domain protein [Oceanibacterium hippocampi]|uniref:Divergent AAA domain protein n=2 Tax=Oceanibacterium hippocampi TaxID=745714 RepID=A0A1Y5S2Q4_9PROT|nr:Divergent AAA domain protein [Oceanibacterium hippocampi]
MLARGQRNRDIQFYFNRQERPVNSGRISQIRGGTYGRDVPTANDAALDAFLITFTPREVGVVVEDNTATQRRTLADRAHGRFERRSDGQWYLADGETSEQECKESFDPRRLTPIVRAVAGLANNRGGFVFIGVTDDECRVVGLPDDTFENTDVSTIADKVKSFLTPTPIFSKCSINLGGLRIGVIHVEKYSLPPVIVCRDGDGLSDGSILFRYPGQSARIKFGDLLAMLRERDHSSQTMLLSSAARLSAIGTDKALIVDTQDGTLDTGNVQITIDRELADQLEFIREGEFLEREGSPTLRLVGDVRAIDQNGQIRERIEERALTADMSVKAYLRHERERTPMEYVRLAAQVQRQWLPLFYFINLSGQNVEQAVQILDATEAVYLLPKQRALERLRGELRAYTALSGNAVPVGEEIQAGEIDGLADRYQPTLIARAIQGLPNDFENVEPLLEILDGLLNTYRSNSAVRGAIYRAASRLDEIEFIELSQVDN